VAADGGVLDHEPGGDLPVGQAVGDELQDFPLAGGELVEGGAGGDSRCWLAGHAVDDPAGDRRGQQGVAGGDGVHGGDQLVRAGSLEQEPGGAGAQAGEDVVVIFEGGQDQHLGSGHRGGQPLGGGDAVQARHAHVHQHDIRAEAAGGVDRLEAVGGLADDGDAGVAGQQLSQAGPHEPVIVGD